MEFNVGIGGRVPELAPYVIGHLLFWWFIRTPDSFTPHAGKIYSRHT
jgi:hypothetical protein